MAVFLRSAAAAVLLCGTHTQALDDGLGITHRQCVNYRHAVCLHKRTLRFRCWD